MNTPSILTKLNANAPRNRVAHDRDKMTRYICLRIPPDGTRVILTSSGEDGPAIYADLTPLYDAEEGWHLEIESNEPEWATLKEVYKHFRHSDMTKDEWRKEVSWVDPVKEYLRKIQSLSPTERDIFYAASETCAQHGNTIIASTIHTHYGQTKTMLSLLVKMKLFRKVKGGYLRTPQPRCLDRG